MLPLGLNHRTADLVDLLIDDQERLRVDRVVLPCGAVVYDFGIHATGGLSAGLELADICMAGLADVMLTQGLFDGKTTPHVTVATDHPVPACLFSQYAGQAVQVDDYFAMGSGPMRAAIATENLFTHLKYREECEAAVGILETSTPPTDAVALHLAERCSIEPQNLTLLVAPVSSLAGTIQVVARSVETCLHQLHEREFDLSRVVSGHGVTPLPPVSPDDLVGIGLTNDAILACAEVTLWVTGDDESLLDVGRQIPASASDAFGRPFLELFEEAGRDFYAIDPALFAPAVVTFQNLTTGRVHRFGEKHESLLVRSIAAAAGRDS